MHLTYGWNISPPDMKMHDVAFRTTKLNMTLDVFIVILFPWQFTGEVVSQVPDWHGVLPPMCTFITLCVM